LLIAQFKIRDPRLWRYLVVGGVNTLIGYVIGVSFLYAFSDLMIIPVVGVLSTVAAVASNYIFFKLLVFKTKENWKAELVRFYKVYLVSTVVGVSTLTICIDIFDFTIFISQALSMLASIGVSSLGNFFFTFKE